MKTLAACLTCFACSAVTTTLFAQGQINWNNTATTLISVSGAPMPVQVSPATTYYFGLFVAPLGTPAPSGINDPNWQFVAAYAMNSTAAAGAGRMQNPGTATVNGFAIGTEVNFIVRGWQSVSGGADWPAAWPGTLAVGQSTLGTAVLGGATIPTPLAFGTGAGQIGGFVLGLALSYWPPDFLDNPSSARVGQGDSVTLHCYAFGRTPIRYQWRKDGNPVAQATNSNLTLTNVTLSDAGNYDVVASNAFGSTTSSVATLTVLVPAVLSSPTHTTNNQFQFTVTGAAGSNYVVQVATHLAAPTTWVSLFTNTSPFTFVDSNAQIFPQRFYRAVAR